MHDRWRTRFVSTPMRSWPHGKLRKSLLPALEVYAPSVLAPGFPLRRCAAGLGQLCCLSNGDIQVAFNGARVEPALAKHDFARTIQDDQRGESGDSKKFVQPVGK